jgi:hypothetical protein
MGVRVACPQDSAPPKAIAPLKDTVLRVENGEITLSTKSPTKRHKGEGTGRIQFRTITRKSGKQYRQPWYDYEMAGCGKTVKKSAYIPKRLLARVQALEAAKAPVPEVLRVLGVGNQRAMKSKSPTNFRRKNTPSDESKSPTKRRGKNKLPPSGHISPTIQRKNGKEYPRIQGARVPLDLAWDYPEQFVWIYNWCVQDEDGCWKNRSKCVSMGKIYSVRAAITANKPVSEILQLIEQP